MDTTTPHDGPGGADEVREQIGRGLGDARERLESLRGDAAAFIRARPGTALLMGLVAGYLIGRLVR